MHWFWIGTGLLMLGIVSQAVSRILARHFNLFDHPSARKIHNQPVPLSGGTGIIIPAILLILLWPASGALALSVSFQLKLLLAGSLATIYLMGLIDDFRDLKPTSRLSVQALIAFGLWYFGLRLDLIHFGAVTLDLGFLSLPITLLWFMGFMNTSNLMDGMDGLSGGMSLIALLAISVSALATGMSFGYLALALVFLMLSFLTFNLSSERKVFLGDSGSLTLGLLVGVLGILASRNGMTSGLHWEALAIPLAAYSVGIADVFTSILRRSSRQRSIFKADKHHFHHRLLRAGLGRNWTLAALHGVAGLMIFFVVLPTQISLWASALFLIPLTMVLGAGMQLLRTRLIEDRKSVV